MMLYDAHCHLQDPRLADLDWDITSQVSMINGTQESDWDAVAELAAKHPEHVIPSFGLHPWFIQDRSERWLDRLRELLDTHPQAHIGEAGLDRWIQDYDLPDQERVFRQQLELAADRNRAVSVHCLQAWGPTLELLQKGPRPERGFLLHSYGGSLEMVERFAKLGACFSFPGYYLHERKHKQREAFRAMPLDRLLVETDAPDQLLPESLDAYGLTESESGERINHPGNLLRVYQGLAEIRGMEVADLEAQVTSNWQALFGGHR